MSGYVKVETVLGLMCIPEHEYHDQCHRAVFGTPPVATRPPAEWRAVTAAEIYSYSSPSANDELMLALGITPYQPKPIGDGRPAVPPCASCAHCPEQDSSPTQFAADVVASPIERSKSRASTHSFEPFDWSPESLAHFYTPRSAPPASPLYDWSPESMAAMSLAPSYTSPNFDPFAADAPPPPSTGSGFASHSDMPHFHDSEVYLSSTPAYSQTLVDAYDSPYYVPTPDAAYATCSDLSCYQGPQSDFIDYFATARCADAFPPAAQAVAAWQTLQCTGRPNSRLPHHTRLREMQVELERRERAAWKAEVTQDILEHAANPHALSPIAIAQHTAALCVRLLSSTYNCSAVPEVPPALWDLILPQAVQSRPVYPPVRWEQIIEALEEKSVCS
ncbi:hypothetical protein B0H15DRAFT_803252 [Mycena belliarum]|uniref:Uncharacterized protein n=1 Tax=Mycena belliarum TaxID=1033014 RepID=A0AAD6U072_9AGAR|nr:hypothetical protein B0H15DRAFT_803252 [Mycena belliae]